MNKRLRSESPVELFRDLVERAMARQRFSSSESSSFYVVQLLDRFVSLDRLFGAELDDERPLAEHLMEALATDGGRRFTRLRLTGDVALFMSGFFSEAIARRHLDLDYYRRVGGYAYARAARSGPREMAPVFVELSAKFPRFVDVLNEVSEESSISDVSGILRLYEKWLQTKSRRSRDLLRREGIVLGSNAHLVH